MFLLSHDVSEEFDENLNTCCSEQVHRKSFCNQNAFEEFGYQIKTGMIKSPCCVSVTLVFFVQMPIFNVINIAKVDHIMNEKAILSHLLHPFIINM